MAFDARGRLCASNGDTGQVVRILESGQARQLRAPGVILPGGIAAVGGGVRGADRLYIAGVWSLADYDGRTGQLISIGFNSFLGGSVTTPWTVAPDEDDVIVTSWMANLVQIWDPAADTEVASWPDSAVPVNAIHFGDDLVVAELGTGFVVSQTPGGARSTIADGLLVPSGLAATDDDLLVTDWATGIVWQIVTDGTPTMVPVKTGLVNPEGIAVDHDGSLLVVETGAGRLIRMPGASDTPPAYALNGVAVGPSGAIYVTGHHASVVWRFNGVPH